MNKETLLGMFEYRDGNLYRKHSSGGSKAGDLVGWTTYCNGRPYRKMTFRRRTIYVHQAIFMMEHGYLPRVIDHENGDSLDNHISNLRPADQSRNIANSRMSRANTSGYKGVTWRADTKKWAAQLMVKGKHISLGSFATAEDANAAYVAGSRQHFGEFSRSTESANNRNQDRATQ
jgi:hypothetical protein